MTTMQMSLSGLKKFASMYELFHKRVYEVVKLWGRIDGEDYQPLSYCNEYDEENSMITVEGNYYDDGYMHHWDKQLCLSDLVDSRYPTYLALLQEQAETAERQRKESQPQLSLEEERKMIETLQQLGYSVY